ncbi:MAG: lysophospholipid acyltransferase family protein [Thermodesulfobacteriota bacterium]
MAHKGKKKRRLLKTRAMKNIRYRLLYALILLIRKMPRQWGIAVGRKTGLLFFRIGRKQRNYAIENLKAAFAQEKTEEEIHEIAKNVFLHFGAASIDAIRIPVYAEKDLDDLILPRNFHYAKPLLDSGRGILFLTAHFGNWELMGAWLAAKGYPIRVVATPISDPRLDRLIVDTRNKAGYYNIARGKSPKEIIRSIRKGHSLGFLIDQDTDVKGVFVNFFGRKAHTAVGPVVLAAKYDIPLMPAFMYMKPDTTYVLEFFPPIPLADTGNPAKDIITNTQKCSDAYEAVIRRHPEQWAWMHRRWRKQPGDKL